MCPPLWYQTVLLSGYNFQAFRELPYETMHITGRSWVSNDVYIIIHGKFVWEYTRWLRISRAFL